MSQTLSTVILFVPSLILTVIDGIFLHRALHPKYNAWAVFFGFFVLSYGLMIPSMVNPDMVKFLSLLYYVLRTAYMVFLYKSKAAKKIILIVLLYVCQFGSEIMASSLISTMNVGNPILQMIGAYAIDFAMYGGLLALIAYYSNAMDHYDIGKKSLLFILIPISQLLLLSSTIVYENMDRIVNNSGVEPVQQNVDVFFVVFYIVAVLFSFAADILALRGFFENVRLHETALRVQALEVQNEANLKYYTLLRQSTGEMKKIKHDFSNVLQSLSLLMEKENAEEAKALYGTLVEKVEDVRFAEYCGNNLVNAICSSKAEECEKSGTELTVQAALDENCGIKDFDLCRVLVNMLDNSMEAVSALEPDKKTIRLDIFRKEGYVYIRTTNPSNGQEIKVGKTSKKDKKSHGFGTKILQDIAEQYEGTFLLTTEEDNAVCLWTGKVE